MNSKVKSFLNKGHQRTILAKKNILFSFFIKAFGMVVVFTMVSVSIKYLGKENYGVWVVLSGLIAWSNVFDLGFSHGLRNRLAEAKAHNNLAIGKYYVSTTYAFLLAMAVVLAMVFLPLFSYLDWQSILNTTIMENDTIKYIIYIVFSLFIFQFVLKPVSSIIEAFQWPAISQFITLIGGTLALVGVVFIMLSDASVSLSIYAYIVAGMPVLTLFIASIYFYSKKFSILIPSLKYVKKEYLRKIAGLGISFFVIQLSVLIIFQSDNMIISYLFGPEQVTDYNIVYRYFSIIITVFGVIMAPFWTAFTDAYQKEDFEWIKKTMRTLLKLVFLSAIAAVILFIISDNVYREWINENINISTTLSGLMAFYVVLFGYINVYAFFANGVGKVKIQMIVNSFAAIINIPLSYFFAKVMHMGVSGVVLGTLISLMFIAIILTFQYYKIVQNKASGVWNA